MGRVEQRRNCRSDFQVKGAGYPVKATVLAALTIAVDCREPGPPGQ